MEVKMTSLIEKIVAIVAPHRCVVCGNEDNILCTECMQMHIEHPLPLCALCGAPSPDWRPCRRCRPQTSLEHVWVASSYQGVLAELIRRYKFERSRAAHAPLGQLLVTALPAGDWRLVPIPTATNHIRQRGYDHTLLMARTLVAQRRLPLSPLLRRASDSRQVGADRTERALQAAQAFYVAGTVPPGPLVLVDDVCTTGATLSAAADVLRRAGATEVHAVVCAWRPPTTAPK